MIYAASFSIQSSTCQLGVMPEKELLEKMREFQDRKWETEKIQNNTKLVLLFIMFPVIFILLYTYIFARNSGNSKNKYILFH